MHHPARWLSACVIALAAALGTASAQEKQWRHGLSLMGEVKYPPDFKHFDYVNADAPKGGTLRLSDIGGFDSLNPIIPRGELPSGLGLIYDTLMTSADDEISTEYGLIAESVAYPEDYSSVTYRLRPDAKWHDGEPVTVGDVIFSLDTFKTLNPAQAFYYRNVVKAEETGEREVTFTFDQTGNRELPQIVGQLLILPKHWWQGKDASGKDRDVNASTLEPTLGSGPYRISTVTPGRTIVYERVADYWGKDLPVRIGKNNFDEIVYDFYRDADVALEAFKADEYDWRVENQAKRWATAYEFPAKAKGLVLLEKFPERARGIMQGYVFNLRREKFQDPRVRRAFNFAFNFEEMNTTIFYDQYERIDSYFEGTELASSGLPEGKELEILESVREFVPPEVFTAPYENPVGGDQRAMRGNLRQALALLKEAGWEIRDGKLTNAKTGEVMRVEFLYASPDSERILLSYKPWLERIGIQVDLRLVDNSQYINRLRNFDFDIITSGWAQSLSPGNEQREFFGSQAADRPGSRNTGGIADPAVDKLIETLIFAKDRDELVAATKALDRVLLWNNYVVPQFTSASTRTARWDRFSHPDPLPQYDIGFPTIWWWDEEKAAAVRAAK